MPADLFIDAAHDFALERWRDEARGTEQAQMPLLEARFDAWQAGLSRSKLEAAPSPDLDVPAQWTPAVWEAGFDVAAMLAAQWSAIVGGRTIDPVVAADPTLSNEALIAQMQRSMGIVGA